MKKFLTIFFLIIGLSAALRAQDYQFTQFYAAPLYLNPALTGSSNWARANVLYRAQWPSSAAKYVTQYASFDQNLPMINSGAGFMVSRDVAGRARLRNTSITGTYAYRLTINRKLALRVGAGVGYSWLRIDDALFTRENIDTQSGTVQGTAGLFENFENRQFFDVSSGALLYTKKLWLGASARHLNQPDNSLVRGGEGKYPIYMSFHGGYQFPLFPGQKYMGGADRRPAFISPAFHYKMQDKFTQLDLGAYFFYEFITLGAWYRGIPLSNKETVSILNQDAFALLAGFSTKGLSIAYSYDITVSPLSTINTGGAHEISLTYEFEYKFNPIHGRPSKDQRLIPCPRF